jgi:glycosyltransferase involved in cell wall biosynthesis
VTHAVAVSDRKDDHAAMRILTVGISHTAVCGVRDYNRVVSRIFDQHGCTVETAWWHRDEKWGVDDTRKRALDWLAAVRRTATAFEPDVILWQYSAFSYGYRGLPHLAPAVARTLQSSGAPVSVVLHEFASPFSGRGWRGGVHAAGTRAVLPSIIRRCAGVVVTTEERAKALRRWPWLPTRRVVFVPVFSNLEPSADSPIPRHEPKPIIGVYGFGTDAYQPTPVIEALCQLRRQGRPLELQLIGSPGDATPQASAWRRAAARRGCEDTLKFTGILDEPALAAALTSVGVAVIPNVRGPEPRQGTLAAWLALGLPVVAFDGPHRWQRFGDERALRIVPPTGTALAKAIDELLGDQAMYLAQCRHARRFYLRHMSQEEVANRLLRLLADIRLSKRRPGDTS